MFFYTIAIRGKYMTCIIQQKRGSCLKLFGGDYRQLEGIYGFIVTNSQSNIYDIDHTGAI